MNGDRERINTENDFNIFVGKNIREVHVTMLPDHLENFIEMISKRRQVDRNVVTRPLMMASSIPFNSNVNATNSNASPLVPSDQLENSITSLNRLISQLNNIVNQLGNGMNINVISPTVMNSQKQNAKSAYRGSAIDTETRAAESTGFVNVTSNGAKRGM